MLSSTRLEKLKSKIFVSLKTINWFLIFISLGFFGLFVFVFFIRAAKELLERPVESLLMNQADHFRETQEERELLSQVMPLINTGYV